MVTSINLSCFIFFKKPYKSVFLLVFLNNRLQCTMKRCCDKFTPQAKNCKNTLF